MSSTIQTFYDIMASQYDKLFMDCSCGIRNTGNWACPAWL